MLVVFQTQLLLTTQYFYLLERRSIVFSHVIHPGNHCQAT